MRRKFRGKQRAFFGLPNWQTCIVIMFSMHATLLAQRPSRDSVPTKVRSYERHQSDPIGQAVFVAPAPGFVTNSFADGETAVHFGGAPMGSPGGTRVNVLQSQSSRTRRGSDMLQQHAKEWVQKSPFTSSAFRQHDAVRQAPGPMIPGSGQRPVWKTPYAYGYFGASGKKQWSKSHGFHDRHTQWTLR